jgi:hypothetical protein
MVGFFELIVLLLCCLCGGGLLLLLGLYLVLAGIFHWWPFEQRRYPADEFFVRNQVILAGPRADVEAAVAEVRGANLSLLEPALEFDQLGQPVVDCPDVPDDFVVALYEVGGLFWNVKRAVRALNASAAGQAGRLQAEPNYLSGHPWDPEGSPWDPEGSPWDPEGSPLPNTRPPRRKTHTDAQPQWFLEQWAFERIELAGRPDHLSGQDVLVGVFDTSPFILADGAFQQEQSVDWVNQPAPLSLRVSHPFFAATLRPSRRPTADMRNHGLFVAGMIHALAPGCRTELVRVLANDNRGDLYTLLREVYKFLKSATAAAAPWRGVVLNLSLGIRVPPGEAGFEFPPEVRSLIYLMRAARCLQVVVVAAAGNESHDGQLEFPNLPARLEQVIGVEASTRDRGRACYANRGDIAAPGGDGGAGANNRCVPRAQNCNGPDCEFGVIGPALEDAPHTGFIYWVGSSFATPMVSGLAALVLEAGQGGYTAEQVAEIIRCGAVPVPDGSQGANVINVHRTLTECLRSAEPDTPQQKAADEGPYQGEPEIPPQDQPGGPGDEAAA